MKSRIRFSVAVAANPLNWRFGRWWSGCTRWFCMGPVAFGVTEERDFRHG